MTNNKSSLVRRVWFYALCAVLFFAASGARADVFDTITQSYQTATTGWFSALQGYAQTLFWLLAAIELAWSGITWALEKDNMSSFTAALVKKIMGISFFYALLLNAGTWIPAIVNSLKIAGQNAAGSGGLSPSSIVDQGIFTASTMLEGLKDLSLFDSPMTIVVGGLSALGIVIAFVVIAGQLMVALIESYIAIGAGVLFLGFGGARWTTDFTQKYVSYAFATGVKLFMLYLILGLGMAQASTWAALLATASLENIFAVLGGSLILAFLAFQIPGMAAAMLSGSPSLTAGAAASTAATVAAGTVAAGGAVISPAMREARGGMQAISSGYQANRAEGGSVLGSAVASLGSAGAQMAREAGRNMGDAVGLMKPSEHTSSTLGGRAAQALDQRAATAAERSAAMGGSGDGKSGSTPPSSNPPSGGPGGGEGGTPVAPSSGAPSGGSGGGAAAAAESDAPAPVAAVPPPAIADGGGANGSLSGGSVDYKNLDKPAYQRKQAAESAATAAPAGGSASAAPPAAAGKGSSAPGSAPGGASVASAPASPAPAAASEAAAATASAAPAIADVSPASSAPVAGSLEQEMATPGVSDKLGQEMLTPANETPSTATAPASSSTSPSSTPASSSNAPAPAPAQASNVTPELPGKDFKTAGVQDVRPPQLPQDSAGGGTVHIKLNHSED
jgi:type IV secretion system protein TrbL